MAGNQVRKKTELRQQRRAFEEAHPPARRLVFLCQDWDDAYNVGGMFRVAAGCGAAELWLVGKTPAPPNPMIGVTSLGMHRRVPFREFQKWDEAVSIAKAEGYELIGVEVTDDAVHFMAYEFGDRVCLVLGNEGSGITPGLLRACQASVMIPMYGKGRSLNVHVAAAVVGFEAMMRGTEV